MEVMIQITSEIFALVLGFVLENPRLVFWLIFLDDEAIFLATGFLASFTAVLAAGTELGLLFMEAFECDLVVLSLQLGVGPLCEVYAQRGIEPHDRELLVVIPA